MRLALGLGLLTASAPRPLDAVLRAAGDCQCLLLAHLGVTLNGATVSAWADQSGAGDANRNAAQATASRQPTFVASDANLGGRASLSFDGGDDLATGTWSAQLAQPATWYIVARDTNNAGSYGFLLDGIGSSNRHALYNRTIGSHFAGMYSGTAEVNSTFNMTNLSAVECVVLDSTDAIYVNNSATATVSGNSGAVALTGLKIGWNQAGTAGFQFVGKIAAVAAYAGAHDAATRAALMRALGDYYGITVT